MKRLFMILIAGIVFCQTVPAQKLSIADVEALPGETVAFALTIDVEGGSYSGFQFQMSFPTEGFTTAGTTVASSEWDGAAFSVGDLDASGNANGSAYSTSDTPIPTGERIIGTVKFTVGDAVAVGNYDVTVSGFNFLDGTNYTPVDDVTFTVNVVSAHTIVLDENSTTAPSNADGVNVKVKRTINAGSWSTICLPFAMTESQVKAAFGNDVQLANFAGYETEEDADENIIGIKVNFNDVSLSGGIEANHPYLIKVSNNITEFTIEDVNLDPEDEPTVAAVERTKKQWSEMIGTYVANTKLGGKDPVLFLSSQKFYYSFGKTKMKAYRAYFDFYDVLSSVENAGSRIKMSVSNGNGNTTEIKNADFLPVTMGRVYNLSGQYVGESEQMASLPKGVYIVNGKKVIK